MENGKALLVGDGLQAASYQILAKIDSPMISKLLRLTTWALGSRGLIQGQVLDLYEKPTGMGYILETHKLKTSRLIQTAILGSYLLADEKNHNLRRTVELFRLGHNMGIVFQLLDDLAEVKEDKTAGHEQQINPFVSNYELASKELENALERLEKSMHSTPHLNHMIKQYLNKNDL